MDAMVVAGITRAEQTTGRLWQLLFSCPSMSAIYLVDLELLAHC